MRHRVGAQHCQLRGPKYLGYYRVQRQARTLSCQSPEPIQNEQTQKAFAEGEPIGQPSPGLVTERRPPARDPGKGTTSTRSSKECLLRRREAFAKCVLGRTLAHIFGNGVLIVA